MLSSKTIEILKKNANPVTRSKKKSGNKIILDRDVDKILQSIKKPSKHVRNKNKDVVLSSSSMDILSDVKDGFKHRETEKKNIMTAETLSILQKLHKPEIADKIKAVKKNINNMLERRFPILEIEKTLKLHKIKWNQLNEKYILIDLYKNYGPNEVAKIISSNEFTPSQKQKFIEKCFKVYKQTPPLIWEKILLALYFKESFILYIEHNLTEKSFNLEPFLKNIHYLETKADRIEIIKCFLNICGGENSTMWSNKNNNIAFNGVKLIEALNIKIWQKPDDDLWKIVKALDKEVAEFKAKYSVLQLITQTKHWENDQNHSLFPLTSLEEYNIIRSKCIILEAIKRDHVVWSYTEESVKAWLSTFGKELSKYQKGNTWATILGVGLGGAIGALFGGGVGGVGGGVIGGAVANWMTQQNFNNIFVAVEAAYTTYLDDIDNQNRETKEEREKDLEKALKLQKEQIIEKIEGETPKYYMARDLDKINFFQLNEQITKQAAKHDFLKNHVVTNDQWYNTCIRKNLSKTKLIHKNSDNTPNDLNNTPSTEGLKSGYRGEFVQKNVDGRWQYVDKELKYQFASEVQHIRDMCKTTTELIKETKMSHYYNVLLDSQCMYYDSLKLNDILKNNIESLSTCTSKSFGQFESVCQIYWSELNQNLSKEFLQTRNSANLDKMINLESVSKSVLNLQKAVSQHTISSNQNNNEVLKRMVATQNCIGTTVGIPVSSIRNELVGIKHELVGIKQKRK